MTNSPPAQRGRGRPSSFKREEIVENVMQLFWEHGYNKLSFNEIAKATGLTRASLYNSFDSKEALLLEVIQHYCKQAPDRVLDEVQPGETVTPAFYALFNEASKSRATDTKFRGCFAMNCINELVSSHQRLGPTFLDMYKGRRDLIKNLIQQAIQQKELPDNTNAETTANLIVTFMSGFSIFSKTGASEEDLQKMSACFLKQIGFVCH